jgi:hypothetical protein
VPGLAAAGLAAAAVVRAAQLAHALRVARESLHDASGGGAGG